VVRDARRLLGEGKAKLEDLIAEFEARTTEARRRQEEAESRLAEAEKTQADYEQRLDRLRADADNRRQQALAQAEQILADANAAVENTVREIKEAAAEKEATKEAREKLDEARARISKRKSKVDRRQRSRQRPARNGAEAEPTGPIAVGDHVRLDADGPVGEVLALDAGEALIALGALQSRVDAGRLTKVGGPQSKGKTAARLAARTPGKARRGESRSAAVSTARVRIDLRGQRVDEALANVQRFVDEALVGGVPSVEILHGKGTGALRQAIHDQLRGRPDVTSFAVAPFDRGGDGVTVVDLS
jgi:DNA mismatch repair protein MutS2